jgi:hypothetical protein
MKIMIFFQQMQRGFTHGHSADFAATAGATAALEATFGATFFAGAFTAFLTTFFFCAILIPFVLATFRIIDSIKGLRKRKNAPFGAF